MPRRSTLVALLCAFVLSIGSAEAKPRHCHHHHLSEIIHKGLDHIRAGFQTAELTTMRGFHFIVANKYADRFRSFVHDLEARGYVIPFIGGYRHTNIAGTHHLSCHAFGQAIDIAQVSRNHVRMKFPSDINKMAREHGLFHGAEWRHADTGHFQTAECWGSKIGGGRHHARI